MKKVLVGGRFNIIHPGHIRFLKEAKAAGDYLVVVIANDKTIKSNKKTLLFPAKERKKAVEAIKYVDKVVIGYSISGEEDYIKIIKDIKPNIIALGYDQKINISKLKKKTGHCKFIRIKNYKGYKTRELLGKG